MSGGLTISAVRRNFAGEDGRPLDKAMGNNEVDFIYPIFREGTFSVAKGVARQGELRAFHEWGTGQPEWMVKD